MALPIHVSLEKKTPHIVSPKDTVIEMSNVCHCEIHYRFHVMEFGMSCEWQGKVRYRHRYRFIIIMLIIRQ